MTVSRRSLMIGGLTGTAAALVAAGAPDTILYSRASAAAPLKAFGQAGSVMRRLGDIEITALLDGYLGVDEDKIVGYNADQAKTDRQSAFIADKGPIAIPVSAYLINTGKKLVMIDAGTANAFGPTLGHLSKSIEAAGYRAEQIDTVLVTHMHPDHVYGLADRKGGKVFPNAELVIPETEYRFWLDDGNIREEMQQLFKFARDGVAPYKTNIRLISKQQEVLPGIISVPMPGHTPGHTGYRISSGNESLLVVADLLHVAAVQFAHPDWTLVFDMDRDLAIANRKKVLDEIATDRLFVAGMHLPFPGFGHVLKEGNGYRHVPAEWQYAH